MKILIHSTTLDGEPLEAGGIALEGKNCAELVEIMKGQTPFTIEATTRDYMLGVLGRIEQDRELQLPEDPEAIAALHRQSNGLPELRAEATMHQSRRANGHAHAARVGA